VSARDEVLARVRAVEGTGAAPDSDHRAVVPVIEQSGSSAAQTLDLFAENVADYRAEVVRVGAGGVPAAVAQALSGVASVVVPTGLDRSWLSHASGVRVVEDDQLSAGALDALDAVVTAAAVGIATTGTIVLDHGPDQGRRAITLVPDTHVCVVREDQVVHDVPEAVRRLRPGAEPRPLTWVSGPSATSDIELDRVEGVHGPRTLVVVITP
jgi:L-lactate dehydrogenase complex protein LldG